MADFTLNQLQTIIRECAGEDEGAEPLTEAADRTFDDLGYDSLALLETQSRIHREFGVELPEELVVTGSTPRGVVDYVNERLVRAR